MASMTLKGVGKEYRLSGGRKLSAVEDLHLEVADGELLVLAGPSGSGKSTILRMIAGLESVSAGEIFIGNRVVNQVAARNRDVAMVFQNSALYPHLNVRENLGFGLRMRGAPAGEIREKVEEAAELLEMDDLLERFPGSLSGGERQRVALGRAMVRRPRVFLFDEPLSSLDAPARGQLRREILRIHERFCVATVYVTHDQAEALGMAHRLVILQGGRLQQSGNPLEVYQQPENRFVAGFLGNPAMSFLHGTLLLRGAQLFFQEQPPGVMQLPLTDVLARGEVVLGMRPEDVRVHLSEKENTFAGTVTGIELLGAETILHLDTGAQSLLCRLPASSLALTLGATVFLQCDPSKIHLFDANSGQRLR